MKYEARTPKYRSRKPWAQGQGGVRVEAKIHGRRIGVGPPGTGACKKLGDAAYPWDARIPLGRGGMPTKRSFFPFFPSPVLRMEANEEKSRAQ